MGKNGLGLIFQNRSYPRLFEKTRDAGVNDIEQAVSNALAEPIACKGACEHREEC
ncbi:MAG: hypothetical protein CM1200mP41_14640 [Gammaproteobacteria bacterium]|nr:MAG: hypothetical protein CM1200mP41_14640 [Gammaproteobacteria bacterium]